MATVVPVVDVQPRIRPLTLEQWHAMLAAGILAEDERVEFIEGEIVELMPPVPQHQAPINVLTRHFGRDAPDEWFIQVQGPMTLPDSVSEPQPDLAVIRFDAVKAAHWSQALLVVEVAVSSLSYDRGRKGRVYARAGVPEHWVVDVPGRRVEVRTRPEDGEYRELHTAGGDEELVATTVRAPALRVSSLFG